MKGEEQSECKCFIQNNADAILLKKKKLTCHNRLSDMCHLTTININISAKKKNLLQIALNFLTIGHSATINILITLGGH